MYACDLALHKPNALHMLDTISFGENSIELTICREIENLYGFLALVEWDESAKED